MRRVGAFVLFLLSACLFARQIADIPILWTSALSFRLHHEVAAPLCIHLIWPILAFAALVRGARCLGRTNLSGIELKGADVLLLALVPLLLACSYIFQNESFFSMYDPKGFPVHPPEIIAHPRGAWVTPFAHVLAAFVLMIVMTIAWLALKKRKT